MDSFSEPYTRQGDDIGLAQVRDDIALLEAQHRKNGIPLTGRIIHVCHYLPVTATLRRPSTNHHALNPATSLGVLSPPATPPTKAASVLDDAEEEVTVNANANAKDEETKPQAKPQPPAWSLAPRYGHAAMISGIRALSATHEQVIVGWTGDIQADDNPVAHHTDGAETPTGTGDSNAAPASAVASTTSNKPVDKVPVDAISLDDRASLEVALGTFQPKESDPDDEKKTMYVPVWLDDKVAHGHYDGYCKQSGCSYFYYIFYHLKQIK